MSTPNNRHTLRHPDNGRFVSRRQLIQFCVAEEINRLDVPTDELLPPRACSDDHGEAFMIGFAAAKYVAGWDDVG